MDDKYIKLTQEWHKKGYESRQAEIDELQKRIDEAVMELKYINRSIWQDVVDTTIDILKGTNQ